MKARLASLATMCIAIVLNACGDPTSLSANFPTSVDTLSVFALSGTPPSYPSGVSILARRTVQVTGYGAFEVALDINAAGNAVVYPLRLVLGGGGGRPVGLQKATGSFESVLEAPNTGYDTDDPVVLAPGESVVIQSPHNGQQDVCQFALSPFLYAKIGVDSISLATRTVYIKLGVDPNCGFRSFAPGIPTS
jgi:hypothetical protein